MDVMAAEASALTQTRASPEKKSLERAQFGRQNRLAEPPSPPRFEHRALGGLLSEQRSYRPADGSSFRAMYGDSLPRSARAEIRAFITAAEITHLLLRPGTAAEQ